MKRFILAAAAIALILTCAFAFMSCESGPEKLSGSVTVQEWLDKKGEGDDFTVTVTLTELLNPYYGRVEDPTGSVLLFGLWENGEPKAFAEKEINIGDTITIRNPVYNVYEGNVEMKEGTLVNTN